MSGRTKIIVASVLFVVIVGLSLFVGLNWNAVKSVVSAGEVFYTADDVKGAYDKGYTAAVGDRAAYETLIAGLRRTIVENEAAAKKKYDDMVAEYESKLDAINAELDVLISYIDLLESYIVDFDIDIGVGLDQLTLLDLQISAYNVIKNRLEAEISFYQSELAAVAGVGALQFELQSVNQQIGYIQAQLALPCSTSDFLVPPNIDMSFIDASAGYTSSWGNFGTSIEASEYSFARAQLGRDGWNDTYSVVNIVNTVNAFMALGHSVYSPNGDSHLVISGINASYLCYYYIYIVYNYPLYVQRRTILSNQLSALQSQVGSLESTIADYISRKAVADYVISKNTLSLSIVNEKLTLLIAKKNQIISEG
ncbi:MAG: hypothetical protein LBT30_04895 [Clostridiales bacterium]|jgi:hypothetical protein|nr:hypothetical protein [Clostridiales bacterium]